MSEAIAKAGSAKGSVDRSLIVESAERTMDSVKKTIGLLPRICTETDFQGLQLGRKPPIRNRYHRRGA